MPWFSVQSQTAASATATGYQQQHRGTYLFPAASRYQTRRNEEPGIRQNEQKGIEGFSPASVFKLHFRSPDVKT